VEVNGYKVEPRANLQGANLTEVILIYADLEGAKAEVARFIHASSKVS